MKSKSGPDLEDQKTTISQLGIRLVSICFSFLVCKTFDKHVWLVHLIIELAPENRW